MSLNTFHYCAERKEKAGLFGKLLNLSQVKQSRKVLLKNLNRFPPYAANRFPCFLVSNSRAVIKSYNQV